MFFMVFHTNSLTTVRLSAIMKAMQKKQVYTSLREDSTYLWVLSESERLSIPVAAVIRQIVERAEKAAQTKVEKNVL